MSTRCKLCYIHAGELFTDEDDQNLIEILPVNGELSQKLTNMTDELLQIPFLLHINYIITSLLKWLKNNLYAK